ncbi:hypothetical protein IAT40_000278 [Kwoniella sp. CBS 6097]
MSASTCVPPFPPPILAPIVTARPSQSSFRLSSSSTTSQWTTPSSSSTSRPCRDSTCSGSSDWSCSSGLVTPRGDEKVGHDFYVDGTEYLDLGAKETWWMSTPKTPSSSKSQAKPRFRVEDSLILPATYRDIPLAESPTLPPQEVPLPLVESPTLPATSVTRDAIPLDDSPTLPSTSRGVSNHVPPLHLDARMYAGKVPLSLKKLGKMPVRYQDVGWETTEMDRVSRDSPVEGRRAHSPFDLVGLLNSASNEVSVPIQYSTSKCDSIFDVHLSHPLASYPSSSSLASSIALERGEPRIPSRTSSRPKPTPPARGSSLRPLLSTSSSSTSSKSTPSTSSSQSTYNPLGKGSHRPTPVRNLSHPPPSNLTQHRTASLKLKKRLSPTLLQPISETPKDLDLIPDGNWALRTPISKLGRSKSAPNLRSEKNRDMTLKFKLRRSNSQSASAGASQNGDAPFVSFPTSRTDAELGGEREGRASLSDIARSFIPRSTPAVAEERPAPQPLRKSPRQNLLSLKGRSASARRPSLLGLPEFSLKPQTTRSTSDSAIGINLAHVPAYALPNSRAATLLRGRSTPSVSLDLPRLMMTESLDKPAPALDDVFTLSLSGSPTPSSHLSFSTQGSTNVAYDEEDQEEALLAIMEAEKWDWPAPPFRITTHTPGLSTSATLDSLITPLTPPSEAGSDAIGSEGECWIHGEAEWMERSMTASGNAKRAVVFGHSEGVRPIGWRPLSVGSGSVRSLDIAL